MTMTTKDRDTSTLLIPALGGVYAGLAPLAELLLRIVVGVNLMPHGAQKLFGLFGGGGISGTGQFLEGVGYSPGVLWAVLVGCLEFFGGALLALGLLTRLVALAVVIFMINIVIFHLPEGFFWNNGGYEYPLLWGVAAFYFLMRGAGPISVDRRLGREL